MILSVTLRRALLLGVAGIIVPAAGQAQTVVNVSNLPASLASGGAAGSTLDIANIASVLARGGSAAAISDIAQAGANTLNGTGVIDGAPLSLGVAGQGVTINMLAAAGYGQGNLLATTSLSVGNANAAISNGLNQIIGLSPQPGYGAQPAGAVAGGSQSGTNTLNAASITTPATSAVTLSQMPAVVGVSGGYVEPTASSLATALPGSYSQSGAIFDPALATSPVRPNLNLSVVNNLLAYAAGGSASAGGSGSAPAAQSAGNTFNYASVGGSQTVNVQQLADFPSVSPLGGAIAPWSLLPTTSAMQAVNTATAYDGQLGNANIVAGAVPPADLTRVANLGQSANTMINTLNLAPTDAGSGPSASIGGQQSGSLPWVVSTNQAVASSGIGAGTYGISNGILLSASGSANWAGLASSLGAAGLPAPGSTTSFAALPSPSTASVSGVGQSLGIALNGLNATGSLQFGGTGFSQSIGSMALASSVQNDATAGWTVAGAVQPYNNFAPSALNAATAVGGAGFASGVNLTQAAQVSGNSLYASGGIGGTLSQTANLIDYGAAGLIPAASQSPQTPGLTPYSGAGAQQGAPGSSSYGAYIASPGAVGGGAALNGAVAVLTGPGQATLGNVMQAANGVVNSVNVGGTIATGTTGTITQQVGTFANYGGTLNNQIALAAGPGTASVSAPGQSASLMVNGIAAGGAISGSIAQTAPSTPLTGAPVQPSNAILALAMSGGGANVAVAQSGAVTQSNVQNLNIIASGSSIGAADANVAVSQTAPAISFVVDGVTPQPVNAIQAFTWRPDNASGTMANSQIQGASQVASLSVNGMSAAGGATGTLTQFSGGLTSSTLNVQSGYSGFCATCTIADAFPRGATGSGNTLIANASQVNVQSLNTSAYGGALNGAVNVALAGTTNLSTSNQINTVANLGNAKASGTQVVANSVSVISSNH